jgi:hypothetical protein
MALDIPFIPHLRSPIKMKQSLLSLAIAAALASSAVMAGAPITTYDRVTTAGAGSKTETKAYVGLNWSLDGGAMPSLVLGALRPRVKSDGDTEGANLAFFINLAGGIKPGKLKLSYINGKEDVQGELGVGYDFLKAAPLLGLGVNAPYVNAGVDLYQGPGFNPYATIYSHGKFKKPQGSSQQCVPVTGPGGAFTDNQCQNPNNPV